MTFNGTITSIYLYEPTVKKIVLYKYSNMTTGVMEKIQM